MLEKSRGGGLNQRAPSIIITERKDPGCFRQPKKYLFRAEVTDRIFAMLMKA